MSHANARLTVHGRRLLVRRVVDDQRPVAHVAKELGVSRQCAHRWVNRWRAEGEAGLLDRSSRPLTCPRRTPAEVEERVLELRRQHRRGQDWIGPEAGLPARTVSAILRRHGVPYLRECDPLTGEVIRASKTTAVRYERSRPGELIHMDVKKIGRIPDGGGWKAHGRAATDPTKWRRRVGYDYIHAVVDDYTRFAYCEILPDEKGATCAQFLRRAAAFLAAAGITRIERVMTDNHFSYTRSADLQAVIRDELGAKHKLIRPHCPWQNGKVERFNRTLATEWAYAHVFTSNNDRAQALTPWLQHYNTKRRHSALGAKPPTSRLS